jgi:putative Mg2+ transporter-C (MgtC) family protein
MISDDLDDPPRRPKKSKKDKDKDKGEAVQRGVNGTVPNATVLEKQKALLKKVAKDAAALTNATRRKEKAEEEEREAAVAELKDLVAKAESKGPDQLEKLKLQIEKKIEKAREETEDLREEMFTFPAFGMLLLWAWPYLLMPSLRQLVKLGVFPLAAVEPFFGQLEVLRTVSTRMLVAAGCGAIIGLERKDADRPAGLRSLTLVSTGSALYVLACMYSPEIFGRGDAARAAAQVCTGVGFIGAGVIAKGGGRGDPVRGVTTACAVWVTAAIGVAAAAGLHLLAFYSCGLTVTILRVSRWYNLITQSRVARGMAHAMEVIFQDSDSSSEPPSSWRRSATGRARQFTGVLNGRLRSGGGYPLRRLGRSDDD